MVGHFLFDDQLVLGVDRDLNVVADSDARVRRHGAAVGIGQGYLVFARAFELLQHGVVLTALLAQSLDLLGEIFHPRAARRLFRGVALVEPLEVLGQPLVGRLDEFLQRIAGEISILVVDRLDAGPVHRQQFASDQVELAQQRELTNTDLKAVRLSARKSAMVLKSGFSVRISQMTSMLRWHWPPTAGSNARD